MRRSPYTRFHSDELTLRDVLAVDRTLVANERTLLGYIRTTLALLAGGASLLHFFEGSLTTVSGIALLASSVPVFVLGVRHYIVRRRTLVPLMLGGAQGKAPADAVPSGSIVQFDRVGEADDQTNARELEAS
jgi:putative membrane protein